MKESWFTDLGRQAAGPGKKLGLTTNEIEHLKFRRLQPSEPQVFFREGIFT